MVLVQTSVHRHNMFVLGWALAAAHDIDAMVTTTFYGPSRCLVWVRKNRVGGQ